MPHCSAKSDLTGYQKVLLARVASTGNIDISTALENGDTLNGVTLATGNVVFLWKQTTGSENGLWVVKASGAPDRYSLLPAGAVADGVLVQVTAGTLYKDQIFVCTSNGSVVGTAPGESPATFRVARVPFLGNTDYRFLLPPLTAGGAWEYAVVPRDGSLPEGNAGTPATVTIDAAVYPPDLTRQGDGSRFSIAVDAGDLVLGFTPGGTA